eukprot:m51a1_g8310 putative protein kinase (2055) ;mRNA; f:75379-83383
MSAPSSSHASPAAQRRPPTASTPARIALGRPSPAPAIQPQDITLHVLSKEALVSKMKRRPPGAIIIWANETPDQQQGQPLPPVDNGDRKLMFSMKLRSHVWSEPLELRVRIKWDKGKVAVCKAERRVFVEAQKLSTEVVPRLQSFIADVLVDPNYMDFLDTGDLRRELRFKEYVVFPCNCGVTPKFVVAKINLVGALETQSVMRSSNDLVVERQGRVTGSAPSSWGEFLRGFIGDLDLSPSTRAFRIGDRSSFAAAQTTRQEKLALFDALKQMLPGFSSQASQPSDSALLMGVSALAKELIGAAPSESERMAWVAKGAMPLLLKSLCVLCDDRTAIVCDAYALFMRASSDLCVEAASSVLSHLESHGDCYPVAWLLSRLCEVAAFREAARDVLAIPRLQEVYFKAMVMIFGGAATKSLGVLSFTSSTSGSSTFGLDPVFDSPSHILHQDSFGGEESPLVENTQVALKQTETCDSPSVLPRSDGSRKSPLGSPLEKPKGLTFKLGQPAHPLIPILKLPMKPDKGETQAGSPLSDRAPQVRQKLIELAMKLGQYYIATDLPVLLRYKHVVETAKKTKDQFKDSLRKTPIRIPRLLASDSAEEAPRKHEPAHRLRCHLLRAFELLAKESDFRCATVAGETPAALLYCDAALSHRDVSFSEDCFYLRSLWGALSNVAAHAERIHRVDWHSIMRDVSGDWEKLSLRKKLDPFLWRVSSRLNALALFASELCVQMQMLSRYMKNCETRISAIQAADLCLEPLLKIKHWLFQHALTGITEMGILHMLLEVLDSIAMQSRHLQLSSFMLSAFMHRPETWQRIRDYTIAILLDKRIAEDLTTLPNGERLLKQYRVRIVKHFQVCVDLLEVQFRGRKLSGATGEAADTDPVKEPLVDIFRKLEFLFDPATGCALEFLREGSHIDHNFMVKREILLLLAKVISSKMSPFVRKKSYIETYLSLSYVAFAKLYHSNVCDPETMELCNLHMSVLLGFASNRCTKSTMKPKAIVPSLGLGLKLPPPGIFSGENSKDNSGSGEQSKDKPFVPPLGLKLASPSVPSSEGSKDSSTSGEQGSDKHTVPTLKLSQPLQSSGEGSKENPSSGEQSKERPFIPPLGLGLKLPSPAYFFSSGEPSKDSNGSAGEQAKDKPVPSLKLGATARSPKEKPVVPSLAIGGVVPKQAPPLSPKKAIESSPRKQGMASPRRVPPLAISMDSRTTTTSAEVKVPLLSLSMGNEKKDAEKKAGEPRKGLAIPKLLLTPELTVLKKSKELGQHAKLQLQLGKQKPPPGMPCEPLAQDSENAAQMDSVYMGMRESRKIYSDNSLHVKMLTFVIINILTHNGTLDPRLNDQFPIQNKKLNIPFVLWLHLSHKANFSLLPELYHAVREAGDAPFRLLKLLSKRFFDTEMYRDLKKLAAGAYGTVYQCKLEHSASKSQNGIPEPNRDLVVKLMHLPGTIHDRCVLHDIFTEVLVLDKFKTDRRVTHLYDYGLDDENFWLVMKQYKTSLRTWRKAQKEPLSKMLPLYLNIYTKVLDACQFMSDHCVNHYDLKMDNVLVHPIDEGTPEEEFWNQPTSSPNFYVCLADFGESKAYSTEEEGYTMRNRGTEYIKSPEMLTVAYSAEKTRETYDRRKKVGANCASDVWSLACLLYELLTGEFLFYEEDWVCFYMRVTHPSQELITQACIDRLEGYKEIIAFLDAVLIRNPIHRPSLREVVVRFNHLKASLLGNQPPRSNTSDIADSASAKYSQSLALPSEVPSLDPDGSIERPSELLPGIFIGSSESCQDIKALITLHQITHLANASAQAAPDPLCFTVHECHVRTPAEFVPKLEELIFFARKALLEGGRVLIYSCTGASDAAALAVGVVMSLSLIGYYEAFTHVRDRWFIASVHPALAEQLFRWQLATYSHIHRVATNPTRWPLVPRRHFRCLCGSVVVSFKGSAPVPQVRPCQCETVIRQEGCPNTGAGCKKTLLDAYTRFGYSDETLRWAVTTSDNVLVLSITQKKSFSKARPYSPPAALQMSVHSKDWDMYVCRTCKFPTHAVSHDGVQAALVSNIDVASCGAGVGFSKS